jgi:hypothetical protein
MSLDSELLHSNRQDLLFSFTFFFLGMSGIPIIIRKEMPGIFNIYGLHAVITGIFIVLGGLGLSLLPFFAWIIDK